MRVLKMVLGTLLGLLLIGGLIVFLFMNSIKPNIIDISSTASSLEAIRLLDGPILTSDIHPMLIDEAKKYGYKNVNGPSIIRVPDWIENPLGKYYLYFAHHKGAFIRLAYADTLIGPWTMADDPILPLEQSGLQTIEGEPSGLKTLRKYTSLSETIALIQVAADYEADLNSRNADNQVSSNVTAPHLASPDIIIDNEHKTLKMYYHGVVDGSLQMSKVATSTDGLNFTPKPGIIGLPYFRAFKYRGTYYGIAMPGFLYRSDNAFANFEVRKRWIFDPRTRHFGIHLNGSELIILFTKVGDAPEVIYFTKMDLSSPDWNDWVIESPQELIRPEFDWEGASLAVQPSMRGESGIPVNQLRDPDIFEDNDGRLYLTYSGQGEQNIGIAELKIIN